MFEFEASRELSWDTWNLFYVRYFASEASKKAQEEKVSNSFLEMESMNRSVLLTSVSTCQLYRETVERKAAIFSDGTRFLRQKEESWRR